MLVLGDSFGWGFGVEHQERFSEILEKAHPDWEIINASMNGYGTDQQFIYLRERGISLSPDVVLTLFCINDFQENVSEELYWHFKPLFVIEGRQLSLQNVPVPQPTMKQRLQRFFLGTTYLGPKLNSVKDSLIRLMNSSAGQNGANSDKSSNELTMRDVTHLLISTMSEFCVEQGFRFVLVSVPMDSHWRTSLRETASNEKIPYLALDTHFESTLNKTSFPHDGHWNAKGHELAAGAIDTFLWKKGEFDLLPD